MYYCNVCSEKWFVDNSEIEDTYVCQRCQKNPISFTDINDMDPLKPSILTHGPIYDSFRSEYNMLPSLSNIEECLIARNAVIMQAFHLKGGQTGFKGNVISFPQKVSYIYNVLPRLPSTIKVLIVRCRGSNDEITNAYKDFRVRRNCIQQWLLFLKRWSNPYRDFWRKCMVRRNSSPLIGQNQPIKMLKFWHSANLRQSFLFKRGSCFDQ